LLPGENRPVIAFALEPEIALTSAVGSPYSQAMKLSRSEIQQIPKVELHRHLECSVRLNTLRELAVEAKIKIPDDPAALRDMFLVTTPMRDLETVLKKFLLTQQLLSRAEILTRITRECIEDAVAEGIRILELRYAPTFIQDGHNYLSFDVIHEAICEGIEQCRHLPVAVGLIAIIQRNKSLESAQMVTDFAINHRRSFVGLDLADNEVGFSSRPFTSLFHQALAAGLKITVHAGESIYPESSQAVMDAVENLGAQRIGHGLQIVHNPAAVEFVRTRKIPLELCPTSNWLTNSVSDLANHPFRKLMEEGVLVTVNSDDPGIFGIDLCNEYLVLNRDHGLSLKEFDRCNDVAAAASFIPLNLKQKHWPRPIDKNLAPSVN